MRGVVLLKLVSAFLGAAFAAGPAPAPVGLLENLRLPEPVAPMELGFVAPNEHHPERALPILREAPNGVYLSVGTERGFLGAAIAAKATHLVLVDVDPMAVRFNALNLALLTAAESHHDYLSLRRQADAARWQSVARPAFGRLSALLADPAQWKFWSSYIHGNPSAGFRLLQAPTPVKGTFLSGNYLREKDAFQRLHRMAREGKIGVGSLDLSKTANNQALAEFLAARQVPLSVLDLSNAWQYIDPSRRGKFRLLDSLAPMVNDRSLLQITFSSRELACEWAYVGSRFQTLLSPQSPFHAAGFSDLAKTKPRGGFIDETTRPHENMIQYPALEPAKEAACEDAGVWSTLVNKAKQL